VPPDTYDEARRACDHLMRALEKFRAILDEERRPDAVGDHRLQAHRIAEWAQAIEGWTAWEEGL
jgi:hypothetical protein